MTTQHRGSRIEPFARLRVSVTADQKTVVFKPRCNVRLAFVLADTEDPAGLDACGITLRSEGDSSNTLLAPREDIGTKIPPPLSMVLPPSLHRAEEYPGLFNDMLVGPNQAKTSLELVVHVLDGAVPFDLDLYFFGYPC